MRTLSATSFLSFRIVSSRASLVLQTKSGALHIIYVMSDLENISQPVKPCEIDGGQESSALMVEYSGQTDIVGKELNEHIAHFWPKLRPWSTQVQKYFHPLVVKTKYKIHNQGQDCSQARKQYSQWTSNNPTNKYRVFPRDLWGKHQNHREARSNSLIHQCNQQTQVKLWTWVKRTWN